MKQEKIGKFIAECRKEKGLTQEQLAEKLAITYKSVSKWECGRSLPDPSLMEMLCDNIGISINELFAGERINKDDIDIEIKSVETIIGLSELLSLKSMRYGIIGMLIAFIILVLVSMFKGVTPAPLVSMICAYNGINFISKYRQEKNKIDLLTGIIFLIAMILNTIAFIIK